MRAILIAIAAAAGLAACSSTPEDEQSPAAVEERRQDAPAAGAATTTQPVKPGGVARVDLAAGKTPPRAPHTDPGNILSRRSIFYDLDKYDVKEEFRPLVEAHARYLRDNPGARVLIQGNTDERGSREYNLALGQKRADAMRRLDRVLGALAEEGAAFTPEFPEPCLALREGRLLCDPGNISRPDDAP